MCFEYMSFCPVCGKENVYYKFENLGKQTKRYEYSCGCSEFFMKEALFQRCHDGRQWAYDEAENWRGDSE